MPLLAVAAGGVHADAAFASTRVAPASATADAQCLAMAIYYESGAESRVGKEAVARVVLNRLAHPRYPKSICDVVWQGSTRRTGCQFTFTCDGSLARRPAGPNWAESLQVAQEAVASAPRPELASALNYHADYVRPYWARTLRQVAQIGRHIFYAAPGGTTPPEAAIVATPAVAVQAAPQPAPVPSVWGISLQVAAAAQP